MSMRDLEEERAAHDARIKRSEQELQLRADAVERAAQATKAALEAERRSLEAARVQQESLNRSTALAAGGAEQSLVAQREVLDR